MPDLQSDSQGLESRRELQTFPAMIDDLDKALPMVQLAPMTNAGNGKPINVGKVHWHDTLRKRGENKLTIKLFQYKFSLI